MAFADPLVSYPGKIQCLEIGTGDKACKIGGGSVLPFLSMDGKCAEKPLIAVEVLDHEPADFPAALHEAYAKVSHDPVAWALYAQNEIKADMICLRLNSTHPDRGNTSADEAAESVKKVLAAIDIPLIIIGSNHVDKDAEVIKKCAEAAAGTPCIIGKAQEANYKTFVAAATAYGHSLIALSDLDINLAKQLNILLTQMDFPKDKIFMDTMSSALGYGLEYTYSVMERVRLAGLAQNDAMLQMPIINDIGGEVWKTRESKVPTADAPELGDVTNRGVLWEAVTATSLLMAGGNFLIMRSPRAIEIVRKTIDSLSC